MRRIRCWRAAIARGFSCRSFVGVAHSLPTDSQSQKKRKDEIMRRIARAALAVLARAPSHNRTWGGARCRDLTLECVYGGNQQRTEVYHESKQRTIQSHAPIIFAPSLSDYG
jgi:hypothetical protein